MKQNVTFSHFCDAFRDMGRGEQFTYAGKRALFDYLESLSEDMGEEIELDVIALCCEYSEYTSALEAYKDYNGEEWEGLQIDLEEKSVSYGELAEMQAEKEEEEEPKVREWFRERTQVIEGDNVFIIQQF